MFTTNNHLLKTNNYFLFEGAAAVEPRGARRHFTPQGLSIIYIASHLVLERNRHFSGEVLRGEKMLSSGNNPESYITEYTIVYGEKKINNRRWTPCWDSGPEENSVFRLILFFITKF